MEKNVTKNEQIGRIVLGIVLGIMACFIGSWSGWVRGLLGIVALAFLGTAFVGY
jgi:Na+-translocating ferredoxin:NAD+ oxidoreductase RnfD subunit